ncbi:3-methylornithine--L-lysine ligase PylC [Dehalobacterium formicoaceticum]|uniref:3-methylornithine--L-lysine ligase PylC n=1 Tax=Dehalobacterium formicoaceticum TaxID=51515 RepID=UPI000B7F926A|nr:3-methylornithine--L-lysine ligase PylC [Dehalobacterium formicoaceticum]
MRIAIIGGKLQGVEACYLAQKASWQVLLIDKDEDIPARALCDEFVQCDVIKEDNKCLNILKESDVILPAMENLAALQTISRYAIQLGIPFVYDQGAYQVSGSKIISNQVFLSTGTPLPRLYPEGRLPWVVKPASSSGSAGVMKIKNEAEFKKLQEKPGFPEQWVVQEFVTGPSYSIEVIGFAGEYQVYQVTELEMDEQYDCKRVWAPSHLDQALVKEFNHIGLTLARHLNLQGIMDVEVILHDGQLKVLEIDARIPSQTPTVVYQSTGVNLVEILGQSFTQGKLQKISMEEQEYQGAVYEHIQVADKRLKVCGEHIMSAVGSLKLIPDFFGGSEGITNYSPGKKEWVATLINRGKTREEAWQKRCLVIERIMKEADITTYIDLSPEEE